MLTSSYVYSYVTDLIANGIIP